MFFNSRCKGSFLLAHSVLPVLLELPCLWIALFGMALCSVRLGWTASAGLLGPNFSNLAYLALFPALHPRLVGLCLDDGALQAVWELPVLRFIDGSALAIL